VFYVSTAKSQYYAAQFLLAVLV